MRAIIRCISVKLDEMSRLDVSGVVMPGRIINAAQPD